MNTEDIKKKFNEDVDAHNGAEVHHGTIVGVLKKAVAGRDDYYRMVLKALTGKSSSKELNAAEWEALFKFVRPFKPEGGHWTSIDPDLLVESCKALVMDALASDTPAS